MDEIDGDGLLQLDIPAPALRVGLVAIGAFVVSIATWELYRGVWPLNATSPFFLCLILGAWSVGVPAIWGGLTGPAIHWTVGSGRIEIVKKRPFSQAWHHLFGPDQIERLETRECPAMEGASTWRVDRPRLQALRHPRLRHPQHR